MKFNVGKVLVSDTEILYHVCFLTNDNFSKITIVNSKVKDWKIINDIPV